MYSSYYLLFLNTACYLLVFSPVFQAVYFHDCFLFCDNCFLFCVEAFEVDVIPCNIFFACVNYSSGSWVKQNQNKTFPLSKIWKHFWFPL